MDLVFLHPVDIFCSETKMPDLSSSSGAIPYNRGMITYREARSEDSAARQLVSQKAWLAAYRHIFTPSEMADLFGGRLHERYDWAQNRSRSLAAFVAEDDGTVVGTSGLSLLKDGRVEVTSLYVHPDFQGRGVGKELWNRALGFARDRGADEIVVCTLKKAGAVEFYRHLGCEEIGAETFIAGERTEPVVVFRKSINA